MFDGDLTLTTNNREFIASAFQNLYPPSYERKSAEKKVIDEKDLWEYDAKTFKSRIGLITNIGTQLFAMLSLFDKDSIEYAEILNRLKICNCLQSMEIDRAKGIQTMSIPRYWTKWQKITGDESGEELSQKILYRRTIADKRPYFFRYLYPAYDKEFKDRMYTFNDCSEAYFNKHFIDLIRQEEFTPEETGLMERFQRFSPLLNSDCPMNLICHHMEDNIEDLKASHKDEFYDFEALVDDNADFRDRNRIVIESIYKKYRQYKVSINYHSNSSGFKEMMHWLNKQAEDIAITSDEIVYWGGQFGSSFLLDVFPDDLIQVLRNFRSNEILIPVASPDGYTEYMGYKYDIIRRQI